MKKKLIVRCSDCDAERVVPEVDPYTGCHYGANYAFSCAVCKGDMVNIRPMPEPGHHELLCEKVLAEKEWKRLAGLKVFSSKGIKLKLKR